MYAQGAGYRTGLLVAVRHLRLVKRSLAWAETEVGAACFCNGRLDSFFPAPCKIARSDDSFACPRGQRRRFELSKRTLGTLDVRDWGKGLVLIEIAVTLLIVS